MEHVRKADTDLRGALSDLLESVARSSGVPGIAADVSVEGLRMSAAFGSAAQGSAVPISSESRFPLACNTKPLTSFVVTALAARGKLALNASLDQLLEEFHGLPQASGVQIQHLLSHTSGFLGASAAALRQFSWPEFCDFFAHTPRLFCPGSVFDYDHTNYFVLGEILRRTTGLCVIDLLRAVLFEPLGLEMSGTEDVLDPHSARLDAFAPPPAARRPWSAAASGITMSTTELVSVLEATCLCGGEDGTPGIWPASARSLYVDSQLIELPRVCMGTLREQHPAAWGLGCARYSAGVLGHNAITRRQTAGFRVSPRHRAAVAVTVSSWHPRTRDFVLDQILCMLGASAGQEPESAVALDMDDAELVGEYVGSAGSIRIQRHTSGNYVCRGPFVPLMFGTDEAAQLTVLGGRNLGFFRDPGSGAPCVMIDLNAFKKQTS